MTCRILRWLILTGLVFPVPVVGARQAASNAGQSARTILQRYADAWRGSQELSFDREYVLAFRIKGELGGDYHLALSEKPGATVIDGATDQYDIAFDLDIDFLRRLDRGELSALTAMGQARSSDPTPLIPRIGPRLREAPDPGLVFRRLAFHFWNREWPEVIPFGEQATRLVHGGNAAVFIYDKEFRTAWYQLKPGMHINADPKDQTNDFPQLVIVTRGRLKGRFDGQERVLTEGQAILIAPGNEARVLG